jgi:hypothetical protein
VIAGGFDNQLVAGFARAIAPVFGDPIALREPRLTGKKSGLEKYQALV